MQVNTQHAKETFSVWDHGQKIGSGPTLAEARTAAGLPTNGIADYLPDAGSRSDRGNSQAATLIRVLIPTGAGINGGHLEQLSAERLRPMFGCSGGSLRLAIAGVSLDVAATVHKVRAGDILQTVTPGRPTHTQEVCEDSISIELSVGPILAGLARKLAGRPIACQLGFGGDIRKGWKTCVASGPHFGESVFRTSPERIDELAIGTQTGEECQIEVI